MKKLIVQIIGGVMLLGVGICFGIFFSSQKEASQVLRPAPAKQQKWTCSMHPAIMLDRPGKCPICHMALIPAGQLQDTSTPNAVKLPPGAIKMLQVETAPVKRREIEFPLPLVGNIEYDETKTAMISAHFDGRVKKLFLNYVGAPVRKGQEIALFFSPDLVLLQRELQMALRDQAKATASGNQYKIADAKLLLTSTKAKIAAWKFDPAQVEKLVKRKGPSPIMPFPAPISGVVTSKNIVEGQYFKRGDRLMSIADTSVMWAVMDAYETDLPWLRYGQQVKITAEALPGKVFKGMIAYIAPEIDKKTRTVRVRANVLNPVGQLRAGMFIKGKVQVEVGLGGGPVLTSLKGKWISPMHPEIIKDKPGKCDVCGMALVPTSSLMTAESAKGDKLPLSIPVSSVLFTGKRSLVYLETGKGVYEPRKVTLGPRAGDYYIIESGLKADEKVVTNGNFQIDSTAQINRTESMMNPKPEKAKPESKHESTEKPARNSKLKTISRNAIDNYVKIWRGLAGDKLADAQKAAQSLSVASNKDSQLKALADQLADAKNISAARADFRVISAAVAERIKNSKDLDKPLYQVQCSMAFNNQGAFWLQDNQNVLNPYFGAAMLHCGEVTKTIPAKTKSKKEHIHGK
jgi:membrane fusion protein, copper/silver efflux system